MVACRNAAIFLLRIERDTQQGMNHEKDALLLAILRISAIFILP